MTSLTGPLAWAVPAQVNIAHLVVLGGLLCLGGVCVGPKVVHNAEVPGRGGLGGTSPLGIRP